MLKEAVGGKLFKQLVQHFGIFFFEIWPTSILLTIEYFAAD